MRFASFRVYSLYRSLVGSACVLATRARRLVAKGAARHLGIAEADTARLLAAVVDHVVISTLDGVETERYDAVDLAVVGRDYALEIQWKPDGAVSIYKTEPLDPWIKKKQSK